jgi:hypothetical protein
MPLLQTPRKPAGRRPGSKSASRPSRAAQRPCAERMLRDLAFVLHAARRVREAIEATAGVGGNA